MNIFDVFTPKADTYYLTDDMTVRQALETFDYHKFSTVPIINAEGEYLTTLSQGDVLRCIKKKGTFDLHDLEHIGIMEIDRYRPYAACKHSLGMAEVVQLGLQQNFIPIVDDRNIYIGIVKRNSIIRKLAEYARDEDEE